MKEDGAKYDIVLYHRLLWYDIVWYCTILMIDVSSPIYLM
jgi:hypothetical protein